MRSWRNLVFVFCKFQVSQNLLPRLLLHVSILIPQICSSNQTRAVCSPPRTSSYPKLSITFSTSNFKPSGLPTTWKRVYLPICASPFVTTSGFPDDPPQPACIRTPPGTTSAVQWSARSPPHVNILLTSDSSSSINQAHASVAEMFRSFKNAESN
ncbi:hypothetical protein L596_011940 [Steinernema carpocapsae]|uniref:Uncharacterized protein n=1 Tax=Steinernema carpocapsae TaxID=34508 RepID=A0A4U5NWE3_STECR|nr:hypothetical protein L596_011940 [Steinernema carpocapsae]